MKYFYDEPSVTSADEDQVEENEGSAVRVGELLHCVPLISVKTISVSAAYCLVLREVRSEGGFERLAL